MTSRIVTANRLRDGVVVYLTPEGAWSEDLQDARVADQDDFVDELLAIAAEGVRARQVIDPYAFAVEAGAAGIVPSGTRERIRSAGPSVRLDLGKQALGR